jgi:hypothetical protein
MPSPWKHPGIYSIIVTTLPEVCNSQRSWWRNTVTSPLSEGSPQHCYVTLYPQTTANTHTKHAIKQPFCISCSQPLWPGLRSKALLGWNSSQLHYESRRSQHDRVPECSLTSTFCKPLKLPVNIFILWLLKVLPLCHVHLFIFIHSLTGRISGYSLACEMPTWEGGGGDAHSSHTCRNGSAMWLDA